MKKKALLIAEKPSLMRDIQNAYNSCKDKVEYDIDFTTQFGHLVELIDPVEINPVFKSWDINLLPIDPAKEGGWKYKVKKDTKKAFLEIQNAIKSGRYDAVIHAGDPDQEGELLVNLTLNKIGNTLPVLRLWSNDTTQAGLENALQNLRNDSEEMFKNFYNAALTRQHADFLFGMNASRAVADRIKTNRENKIAAGRVMTCVQAMIVDREDEIRNFVPSTSYGISVIHINGLKGYLCEQFSKEMQETEDENFGQAYYKTKSEAEEIINSLSPISLVKDVNTKTVKSSPPKLYKLATIQIEAARYGYSAQETLDIIQSLYEKHHYVSYPRTDCEVLSSNEDFKALISSAAAVPSDSFKGAALVAISKIADVKNNKRYVNDKELTKHGHSALIPTTLVPDFSRLNEDEKLIYTMIAKRFLCIFQPPLIQEKTVVLLDNNGHTLRCSGKRVIDKGFTEFTGGEIQDIEIADVRVGENLNVSDKGIVERTTTCPKRFTDGTIISAMENPQKYLTDLSIKDSVDNFSIGTSATRGEILKKLIADKYIIVKKNGKSAGVIYPTEFGSFMIHTIRGISLCSVDMTGQWEQVLSSVRNGQTSFEEANTYMYEKLDTLLSDIKGVNRVTYGEIINFNEPVMKCPGCGCDIIAGPKNYFCTGYKEGCKYSIMKRFCEAEFTANDVRTLFAGGTIEKELTKKETGSKWKQLLKFNVELGKLEFVKAEERQTGWKCPECHELLYSNGKMITCHTCDFKVWTMVSGHTFTEEELERLFTKGCTHTITDFVSKKGTKFSAKIKINDITDEQTGKKRKGTEFQFAKRKTY